MPTSEKYASLSPVDVVFPRCPDATSLTSLSRCRPAVPLPRVRRTRAESEQPYPICPQSQQPCSPSSICAHPVNIPRRPPNFPICPKLSRPVQSAPDLSNMPPNYPIYPRTEKYENLCLVAQCVRLALLFKPKRQIPIRRRQRSGILLIIFARFFSVATLSDGLGRVLGFESGHRDPLCIVGSDRLCCRHAVECAFTHR